MGVLNGYLLAKKLVIGAGFESDVAWAEGLARIQPDPVYVWREAAWVVVNSGFRFAVAQKLWPRIRHAFHDFNPAKLEEPCRARALAVLKHPGKIGAIYKLGELVRDDGIAGILADAREPMKLRRLPWIGSITCWHLAKVLGVDCVKPDVHLQRAARAAGHTTPHELCVVIQAATGDRLTVADSVLWRYGEQQRARGWPAWEALFGVA